MDEAISIIEAVIPDGGNTTGIINLINGTAPIGVFVPIVDTSTAINFEVSPPGEDSFVDLYAAGSIYAITIPGVSAVYIPLDPTVFGGINDLKIKVADNQTGDKTFKLAYRRY